jgi:hypothetical protein
LILIDQLRQFFLLILFLPELIVESEPLVDLDLAQQGFGQVAANAGCPYWPAWRPRRVPLLSLSATTSYRLTCSSAGDQYGCDGKEMSMTVTPSCFPPPYHLL